MLNKIVNLPIKYWALSSILVLAFTGVFFMMVEEFFLAWFVMFILFFGNLPNYNRDLRGKDAPRKVFKNPPKSD